MRVSDASVKPSPNGIPQRSGGIHTIRASEKARTRGGPRMRPQRAPRTPGCRGEALHTHGAGAGETEDKCPRCPAQGRGSRTPDTEPHAQRAAVPRSGRKEGLLRSWPSKKGTSSKLTFSSEYAAGQRPSRQTPKSELCSQNPTAWLRLFPKQQSYHVRVGLSSETTACKNPPSQFTSSKTTTTTKPRKEPKARNLPCQKSSHLEQSN